MFSAAGFGVDTRHMPKLKLKPGDIDELSLLTLEETHAKLGKGYSPRTIRRKIANGEYIQGKHYFRTGGVNGIIKVHLPSIMQNLIDINS
ncbi:hypothetical protein NIES592_08005 [Fischerella major NIES-592]|jgi:hypothetical protein|uniref:Uncharacterized protein n=1 Tax=Fischerella major NIES-592 TaxID=210994 RepID=A0A1U7H1G4_9CYAN|nr:hypothetical protein [Fischerella major]OKH14810.1 hypothetical protein NIES592_08005 [Fischerella major NIES-592]